MSSERSSHRNPPHDESSLTSIDLENGELVVYDPDNHKAWIQSDTSLALADQQ